MAEKDNTLAVVIVIAVVLLFLFSGGFNWLFGLSAPSGNTSEYWATRDLQLGVGQSFGESGATSYTDRIAQKILVPATFTVNEIQICIAYRIGNPASLGTFSIGLASSYDDNFIWHTNFNPNTVELWNSSNSNLIYNFTVPSITVHNATYIRLQYTGIGNNNDTVGDCLLMRTGSLKNQTDEGFRFRLSSITPAGIESREYGGNGNPWILYCGVSGSPSTTTEPQLNMPDLLLLLVIAIIIIIIIGES